MAQIDRVDVRERLKPRRDPYWQRLTGGRFVGYRRLSRSGEGTWLARAAHDGSYEYKPLGDFSSLPERSRFDAAKKMSEDWFQHLDFGGSTDSATVKAVCEIYVEEQRLKSEAAAKDVSGRFERLIYADPIARIDLQKLSPRHISDWKKRVLLSGSKGSFNRNATAFRAALNLAYARRIVSTNHAWVNELKPFKDVDGRRGLYLEMEERRRLLEGLGSEVCGFVRTLLIIPLRPGDVAKLKVADFDALHSSLSIPEGKTRRRTIPLSKQAVKHFKECSKNKLPSAWLISRDGGGQWDRFSWRDAIKEAAIKTNLPTGTCAYTLRHCAITDMVSAGADLFTVAQLSGTSVTMIERNYGHLQRKNAVNALESLALV